MKLSKEVDWSTAPDGATHYNAGCEYPWLKETPASFFDGDGWIEYHASSCKYATKHLKNAVKRQREWDGTGVPPVGTVCEYRLNDGAWFMCKITYILSGTDDCFVAWCDHLGKEQFLTFSSIRYKLQMRKIKTSEQIAAEERLHAIDEMCSVIRESDLKTVAALYDAGYRKTEEQKE